VPVNWDDLEIALTSNSVELTCYFDVRNGEVQMLPVGGGEDEDSPSEEEIDAGLEAGHLVLVEPLGPSIEYGWMVEFADSVSDARLRDLLAVALDGRGAFRRFKDVLLDYQAQRERWFAFRDGRVRAAGFEWLAEQGLEPTTAPPKR